MENVRNLTPAPAPTSGIIASSVYTAGRRVADIPIEEAGDWAKK
ncbi:magnesium transporter, partial [Mesorhizobium sp. M2D.F.Ca.ET.232.01.1.1]